MIKKVKLKNWRSHLDSEFEFSTGTNALLGPMGAGKTSVLDSISFALFGIFPTLQSRKVKLDDIIMRKPFEKDKAEVEVHFQVDGKNYSVRRVIERGKGTTYSELREEGKLIEAPNSQRVTEMVEKILKVNYELFSKAIYSEQNALDEFLKMARGERMKKIDELLMIDKFEKARASLVTLTNRLIDRKLGKQSVIDQVNVEEVKEKIKELKSSLEQISSEKEELSKFLTRVLKERKELEREIKELKEIAEEMERLEKEEEGIRSAMREIKEMMDSLEEALKKKTEEEVTQKLSELDSKVKKLESDLKKKEEEYQKASSKVMEAKAKVEVLRRDKLDNLKREIEGKMRLKEEAEKLKASIGEDAEQRLEELRNLHEKMIGEIERIKGKIEEMSEAIEKLSSSKGVCPVCETKLSEERRKVLITQRREEIERLKEKLEELRKKKDTSELQIKELEKGLKRLNELLTKVEGLEDLIEEMNKSKSLFLELAEKTLRAEKELKGFKEDLEELRKRFEERKKERQELEIIYSKLKDYKEKKRRFEELSTERKNLEEKLEALKKKIAGRDISEMEERLKELIGREKEARTKLESLDQLKEEKEKRLLEYEKNLKEVEKEKREVERLDKIIRDLKILGEALKQTQTELRKDIIEAINYTMNEIWPTLYPYGDYVGIRLAIEKGDYVLQLKERSGRYVNVEGIVSGGERSIACLALRIAFARVLAPQLRWLVLDEPTHNLDVRAVEDLAETLRTRINEFVDQVFLITHEEKVENAVTGSLYRLVRDKERDGATKVIAS